MIFPETPNPYRISYKALAEVEKAKAYADYKQVVETSGMALALHARRTPSTRTNSSGGSGGSFSRVSTPVTGGLNVVDAAARVRLVVTGRGRHVVRDGRDQRNRRGGMSDEPDCDTDACSA